MASNLVRPAVTFTVLMAAGLGSGHAAEKVRLDDLQVRYLGRVENRSVKVITRDGRKYQTRRLVILDDGLWLDDGHNKLQALPRHEVGRIEIGRGRYYSRHIAENAGLAEMIAGGGFAGPIDGPASLFALVLSTPFWAYTAASAPVFLAADGVAFLIPPKVFEIVQ